MREPRYKAPSSEDIVDRQFLIRDRHGNVVTNSDGDELVGAVLDGKSFTKRHLGKLTLATQAGVGIEQLLHPTIATMVKETGQFEENPYLRIAVSIDPILAVVHAKNPYDAGNYVRMLHNGLSSTASDGRKVFALDPETFYWAHDTFVNLAKKDKEHFTPPEPTRNMNSKEIAKRQWEINEQWQLESNTWYSYYGMPMDMVPADYVAYVPWREDMINNHLTVDGNDMAKWAIDAAVDRKLPRPAKVPESIWRLAQVALTPVTEIMSLATIGEISPDIREKFEIPFSDDEQKRLNELRNIAQAFFHPLPDPITHLPVYKSIVREHGGHKNMRDRLIYKSMSVGGTALKAVADPVLKLVA